MSAAVQLSLLGREAPSFDPNLDGTRRLDLGDGAWVDRMPGWLRGHQILFEQLRDSIPWTCPDVRMYDSVVPTPRLVAFSVPMERCPPIVEQLSITLSRRYQTALTELGLGYYRGGRDSVAWHTDRDGRTRAESLTAIVSVGEPRPFLLRPLGGGASIRMTAGWGDLIVMGGNCQRSWEHCVPKVDSAGPRICLMFRHRPPVGAAANQAPADGAPRRPGD
ncbi:MAG: alpha-ketoglutarate-dependent dioxygenase AlkB [Deltaproteobacteria bacterium]|nr:alpha-ketoglutarate-dependent dioxygenase AlkB [Deltaproteobacteria bacterium]